MSFPNSSPVLKVGLSNRGLEIGTVAFGEWGLLQLVAAGCVIRVLGLSSKSDTGRSGWGRVLVGRDEVRFFPPLLRDDHQEAGQGLAHTTPYTTHAHPLPLASPSSPRQRVWPICLGYQLYTPPPSKSNPDQPQTQLHHLF